MVKSRKSRRRKNLNGTISQFQSLVGSSVSTKVHCIQIGRILFDGNNNITRKFGMNKQQQLVESISSLWFKVSNGTLLVAIIEFHIRLESVASAL